MILGSVFNVNNRYRLARYRAALFLLLKSVLSVSDKQRLLVFAMANHLAQKFFYNFLKSAEIQAFAFKFLAKQCAA